MNVNIFEKANVIVDTAKDCYLALIDENGRPTVSTISSGETDGIFKAYFATNPNGNKGRRISKNNGASVCYRKDNDNVTLVGNARILTDEKSKLSHWEDWYINHFPKGPADPNYCVLEFTTERVSFWIDNEGAEFTIDELLRIQSRCGLLCDGCSFRESMNCGKCAETCGKPFYGDCPIAACCQEKGFEHCGECPDMPCEPLEAYSCEDKEHGDNPPGARLSVLKYWKKYNKIISEY